MSPSAQSMIDFLDDFRRWLRRYKSRSCLKMLLVLLWWYHRTFCWLSWFCSLCSLFCWSRESGARGGFVVLETWARVLLLRWGLDTIYNVSEGNPNPANPKDARDPRYEWEIKGRCLGSWGRHPTQCPIIYFYIYETISLFKNRIPNTGRETRRN